MRIISGRARGSKLQTIEGLNTRPTTDRVKESLFNLLQYDFYNKVVLDLFAGSGALGLEAVSRGAQKAIFVDENKACCEIIKKNIAKIKADENCLVLQTDVQSAIKRQGQSSVDFVFMDPPYHKGLIEPTLEQLLSAGILKEAAVISVEHEKTDLFSVPEGYECLKQRSYGITTLSILRRTT